MAPRLEGDRVSSTYTLGAIYRYLKRNDFRAEVVYRTVGGWVDHAYGVTLGYGLPPPCCSPSARVCVRRAAALPRALQPRRQRPLQLPPRQPTSNSLRACARRCALRAARKQGLKSTYIRVRAHDGVVTLSGVVANENQISLATSMAQGVSGVRNVNSKIEVRSGAGAPLGNQ